MEYFVKKILILIISVLISCSFAHPSSSVLVNWNDKQKPPKLLTSQMVREDVAYLLKVFDQAYVGKQHLPSHFYYQMLSKISSIHGSLTTEQLKDTLDEIFLGVPDGHLMAMTYNPSPKRALEFNMHYSNAPTTGVNYYRSMNQRVLDIKIGRFPDWQSKKWVALMKKIKSLLPKTDLVIVDLQNSPGGKSMAGQSLIRALTGRGNQTAIIKEVHVQTPWSLALMVNLFGQSLFNAKKNKSKEISAVRNNLAEAKERYRESIETPWVEPWGVIEDSVHHRARVHPSKKGYRGPIAVLQSKGCFSTCEITVKSLQMFSNVVSYGQPTAGVMHFGNAAPLKLPNSRISVTMPTVYIEMYDHVFSEKKGLVPDRLVPASVDIRKVVLHQIKWLKSKARNK